VGTWVMIMILVGLFLLAGVLSVGPRVAQRRSRLDAYLGVREPDPRVGNPEGADTRRQQGQPRVWAVLLAGLVLFGVVLAGLGYLVYMWLEGWSK
jgi:hypothetical protein